nr:Gfo/Idh/MocA family oxidoreductase [Longitalea luteola]
MRIAIIGTGSWGRLYLEAALLHKDIEVAAICEPDTSAWQEAKQLFKKAGVSLPAPVNEAGNNYHTLLSRNDIDAVIIATPWHTHYEIAKAALLAGKHVACGPIMGSTVDEHRDIVNISRKTAKQYVTLDELSCRRDLQAIQQMVTTGQLGELQSIQAGAAYTTLHKTTGNSNLPYAVYPAAATAQLLGISANNPYISLRLQQQQQDYVIAKSNAKTGKTSLFVTRGLVSTIRLSTGNRQTVYLQSTSNIDQPFSTGFRLQATGGSWLDISKTVQLTGATASIRLNDNLPANNQTGRYRQSPAHEAVAMALHDFVKTVQQPVAGNIPVCIAATNSVIGMLADQSAQQGGASIEFPNFFI